MLAAQPRAVLSSLAFASAEERSSYTCSYKHLRALALPRTHRALTHRTLGLIPGPDLALALDIIIIVVMSAVGSELSQKQKKHILHGLPAKRSMLYPTMPWICGGDIVNIGHTQL